MTTPIRTLERALKQYEEILKDCEECYPGGGSSQLTEHCIKEHKQALSILYNIQEIGTNNG